MPTQPCPCKKKSCPRHGDCAACLREHTPENRRYPLPYCQRLKKGTPSAQPRKGTQL